MFGSRVSRRYAKALFDLASEEKNLDRVADDMQQILLVCETSEDFIGLLESPVIPESEKKAIFSQALEKSVHHLSFDFLDLLLQKNRESLLPDIIRHFLHLIDESKGVLRGQLITAYAFTEEQMVSLKKQLDRITAKNVIIEEQVDPSIIGGFVVRLADTVIDNSIRNQLVKMRESLISKA